MEKIVIELEAKTGKAVKDVEKLNKSVTETSKTAKKTGKGLSGAFKGLSGAITGAIPILGKLKTALISTGVGALVVVFGSLVALFKSASDVGAKFQSSLSTLKAITGRTANELGVLNQQAKELGSTTQFTAVQVVELQTELAKLGFTVKDIENSTPAILDLAASLEVDLASAAELAGSVVRSFGLDTLDTQRVVDVMSLSTSASALNFEALRESIKVVAPAARATNVSIEKTAALLGVLANNGLKGSVAGNGLSKTFIELNKKGITLEEGMEKVKNSTNKLNTAIDLVGVVGAKSFLSLAESGEQIKQLEKDFDGAEGAAKRMAEVRLDNLTGDTTKLSSAWEGFLLGIEDGDGIINEIQRGSIQLLTSAISGLGIIIDYLGFSFKDTWEQTKLITGGSVDYLSGQFIKLGNGIKLFANQALLQFAEIPFIGKAIDKSVVENNIKEAREGILKGVKEVEEGIVKLNKASTNVLTFGARFSASQIAKTRRQEVKKQGEIDKKIAADKVVADKKLSDEEKEALKKQREDLAKIEAKAKKQSEDLEDQTELAKAERKRERALAELEAVKLSETEKRKAKKAINDFYDVLEKDAKLKDEEAEKAKDLKKSEEAAEKLVLSKESDLLSFDEKRELIKERENLLKEDSTINEKDKLKLQKQFSDAKIDIAKKEEDAKTKALNGYASALSSISGVIGQETEKGKALAIASSLVNTYAAITGQLKAFSGVPVPGFAIAQAIATGVAGFANIKKIASVKVPNSSGGGSVPSGGSAPSAPATPSLPPAFNVVGASDTNQLADAIGGQSQEPVKAYVVSGDVTSAQSMDRNIVEGASI